MGFVMFALSFVVLGRAMVLLAASAAVIALVVQALPMAKHTSMSSPLGGGFGTCFLLLVFWIVCM